MTGSRQPFKRVGSIPVAYVLGERGAWCGWEVCGVHVKSAWEICIQRKPSEVSMHSKSN